MLHRLEGAKVRTLQSLKDKVKHASERDPDIISEKGNLEETSHRSEVSNRIEKRFGLSLAGGCGSRFMLEEAVS